MLLFVTAYPEIAHDYGRLRTALDNDVYPAERHYLDYKLTLYTPASADGTLLKGKSKDKVHDELAKDMASFGARGGHLIYGVREDKENHRFIPEEMDLPTHLDLAVVDVARTRIHPPLTVVPYVLGRPGEGSRGFLVIEIPESPTAPHGVRGTYYGRSEVGRVILTDADIEEQILRRGRVATRLEEAMRETQELADSLFSRDNPISHMMLTAVPTQPVPEMFLPYTINNAAQERFITDVLMELLNSILKAGDKRNFVDVAFDHLTFKGRTSRGRGAWFASWPTGQDVSNGGERWLGVGDNGVIRFANLDVSSLPTGGSRAMGTVGSINDRQGAPILYHDKIALHALDVMRLIGHVADRIGYGGSWLIGLELNRLHGLTAQGRRNALDSVTYTQTTRITATALVEHPKRCTNDLLRPLFRDLGIESNMEPDD